MRSLRARGPGASAAALALVFALATLGPGARAQSSSDTSSITSTESSTNSSDGTSIHVTLWSPPEATAENMLPLIVLPSSWGFGESMYASRAPIIAALGYVVVGYTPRGFGDSGGEIEVASANDVADLDAVIEWAGNNSYGDAHNVGVMAISYGAGIASLASCTNDRIKAVAHMSGWGDFGEALFGELTQHSQTTQALLIVAAPNGRRGEVLDSLLNAFDSNNATAIDDFSWPRSPISCIDEINRRQVPHLLSDGWRDSIFPVNQYMDFYDALTVPKRFELGYQDHAMAAFAGLDSNTTGDIWDHCQQWMDAYLKNDSSSPILSREPVEFTVDADAEVESGESFEALAPNSTSLDFSGTTLAVASQQAAEASQDNSTVEWSGSFSVDGDAGADTGFTELRNILALDTNTPLRVFFPGLDRTYGIVMTSETLDQGLQIRGRTRFQGTVGSTGGKGTFVAYLYDVGALGVAKLITHAPYTFYHESNSTAPEPFELDIYAALYDIPAGNSLGLVIQPSDQRYTSHNPSGSSITFEGTPQHPLRLTVPRK